MLAEVTSERLLMDKGVSRLPAEEGSVQGVLQVIGYHSIFL